MVSTRLLSIGATFAAAVALGGCVSISSVSVSQQQSMGPLRLSLTACASESPSCPAAGNGGSLYRVLVQAASTEEWPVQPLVAMRLPDGATPPDAFNATAAGGRTIAFARSSSYETALQQLEPAPAGERWWGWLGAQVTYGRLTGQSFSLAVEVPLPRPADGGPAPSPMRWRPVVGARIVDLANGLTANRPVVCGTTASDLYEGFAEIASATPTSSCVTSPSAEAARGYLDAPLVDFGLTGTTVQTPAGGTTTATFLARRSGLADPATTFALSVAGGPPGAQVTIDRTTVGLGGDAVTPVQATVVVPAGTAAGTYPVTLTATAAGKPTRTAVAAVVVTAAAPVGGAGGSGAGGAGDGDGDGAAPRIERATLAPGRFRAGPRVVPRRGRRTAVGTTVRLSLTGAATVATRVERRLDGRRAAGGRCRATARRGARCAVWKAAGRLPSRALPSGAGSFPFTGRLRGRSLPAGRYRLVLTAAGQRPTPVALPFTVVRR
jgi:hypothetical protein